MTMFSAVFTGIFLFFILAAIVGHVLLIGALLRPFLGGLALPPAPTKSSILTAR